MKCEDCKGRGSITKSRRNEFGSWVYSEIECHCKKEPEQPEKQCSCVFECCDHQQCGNCLSCVGMLTRDFI